MRSTARTATPTADLTRAADAAAAGAAAGAAGAAWGGAHGWLLVLLLLPLLMPKGSHVLEEACCDAVPVAPGEAPPVVSPGITPPTAAAGDACEGHTAAWVLLLLLLLLLAALACPCDGDGWAGCCCCWLPAVLVKHSGSGTSTNLTRCCCCCCCSRVVPVVCGGVGSGGSCSRCTRGCTITAVRLSNSFKLHNRWEPAQKCWSGARGAQGRAQHKYALVVVVYSQLGAHCTTALPSQLGGL